MKKLQTLVEKLYKELELPGAPTSDKTGAGMGGGYAIPFEGITITAFEYALMPDSPLETGIALMAVITPCSETNPAALYRAAMLGNLFGVSTQQSIIGLSANGKNLTLCREIEYNCDYTEFQDILEAFLNTVEIWRETAAIQERAAA